MTWTNGKHQYKGKTNSRSQRQIAKILKGIKRKDLPKPWVWKLLEKENAKSNNA